MFSWQKGMKKALNGYFLVLFAVHCGGETRQRMRGLCYTAKTCIHARNCYSEPRQRGPSSADRYV